MFRRTGVCEVTWGGGLLMLTRRVVVGRDVKDGRVGKGTLFVNLRDVGDPVELATRYGREGADEIVFLDISASSEARGTLLDVAGGRVGRVGRLGGAGRGGWRGRGMGRGWQQRQSRQRDKGRDENGDR